MNEMMFNDTSKHMMHQRMKSDLGMMKKDSSLMHKIMSENKNMQIKMIEHMVQMAEKDSVLFNTMMTRMNSKPEMRTRMMKISNSKMK